MAVDPGVLARMLVAVFFPPLCLLCEAPVGDERPEVCRACREGFRRPRPPLCRRCGSPRSRAEATCGFCARWAAVSCARSALLFAGPVRGWIHGLKYAGMEALAALAVEPLNSCWRDAPELGREASALVPVPLYPARRRERGYNQSELLALRLGETIGMPCLPLLQRRRPTRPQVGLDAAARRGNVRDAFVVPADRRAHCRGRTFVLMDDVLTTGATLEEAAGALLGAGASRVDALTLARALPGAEDGRPKPGPAFG
ncbi:MAG: ComF family protein [Gemmatimonadetes bacterium]|nr:ComF family protein [Gemmatimonadota bacterium]